MCDTVFAFGQRGGYHFESPSRWKHGFLPAKLMTLFIEIKTVYCLALGARESFFICYSSKDGFDHIACDCIPGALKEFLYEKSTSGSFARHFPDIRVSLGPYNNSWWATDGISYCWSNLPKGLAIAVESRRKPGGDFTDPPRLVTLGAQDSYLMLTDANCCVYSLTPSYRNLDALLESMRDSATRFSLVHNVILDAYRLQSFVLQNKNGSVFAGTVAPHAAEAIADMLQTIKTDTDALRDRDLGAQWTRARQMRRLETRVTQPRVLKSLLIARENQSRGMDQAVQAAQAMTEMSLGIMTASFRFNIARRGRF